MSCTLNIIIKKCINQAPELSERLAVHYRNEQKKNRVTAAQFTSVNEVIASTLRSPLHIFTVS